MRNDKVMRLKIDNIMNREKQIFIGFPWNQNHLRLVESQKVPEIIYVVTQFNK